MNEVFVEHGSNDILLPLENKLRDQGIEIGDSKSFHKLGGKPGQGRYQIPLSWLLPRIPGMTSNMPVDMSYDYFLTRWFDNDWSEQTVLGIPVRGLMPRNLGAYQEIGVGTTYLPEGKGSKRFRNEALENLLHELSHVGPVSLQCVGEDVVDVMLGVPGYGLYNLLPADPRGIFEFFFEHENVRESWTVSALLSRYPWPQETEKDEVSIKLSKDILRYQYLFCPNPNSEWVTRTNSTKVLISIGFGYDLYHAARLAVGGCARIHIKEAQYRPDLGYQIEDVWQAIKSIV